MTATDSDKKAAEILKANLAEDEKRLAETESLAEELRARVSATRAWLVAYGFMSNSHHPPIKVHSAPATPSTEHSSSSNEKTFAVIAGLLKQKPAMKMIDVFRSVQQRGLALTRSSVDSSVRRHPELFVLEMKDGENWVRLKGK